MQKGLEREEEVESNEIELFNTEMATGADENVSAIPARRFR